MNEDLITIDALVQLFWDYKSEDIEYLRSRSADFDYIWNEYVIERDKERWPQTNHLIWELWLTKFSNDTKVLLIEYAKQQYGEEKRQGIEQAARFKQLMQQHVEKEDAKRSQR